MGKICTTFVKENTQTSDDTDQLFDQRYITFHSPSTVCRVYLGPINFQ